MPGALTTLLANNAMHLVPGGKRRKQTRRGRRRGGYTDWKVVRKEQAEEVMNRYGCKEIPACLSVIGEKLREAETREQIIPLRRDRMTLLAHQDDLTGGAAGRTTKKTRKGGSTKPLDELNDLLNHYGCTPYEGYESTNACLASIRDKLDDPNTNDSVRRRITDDYNRIVNLVDQVERTGGRRRRGGTAGRTREQIVADIEGILTKHGCGNYTPESARTCQDVIDAKLDDPNLQPGAPYRAVLNDFTLLNNYLVELRNVGGRRKKTRRT